MFECRVRANKIEELTLLDIQDIIGEHLDHHMPRYMRLQHLYMGDHPILHRRVGENKPNNRLVSDYFGKIIDTEIGYFLGKPVVFNMDEVEAKEELENILIENEFDDLIMEVGKEAGIKGKSAIMVYQDEDSETRLCRISPENVIFLKRKLGNEIGIAIRHWKEYTLDDEEIIHIEVYDDEAIFYLKMYNGVLCEDDSIEGVNPKPHVYGIVPIIPVLNNEEEMGSFEKVITLVEAYDKLISDTSNEHEAYRNSYMVFKNLSADDTTINSLKEHGIIEVFDDGEVYFVNKPILDSAINSQLDRLSSDIHKFVDVPDLSDEAFAGNLSGVAIKFKLFGLENKCIIKERKMTKALRRVLKALKRVIEVKTGEEIDVNGVQIIFTRNIPMNLTETTQVVTSLKGIVDTETLLSLLPFVDNPQEIMEALAKENDDYATDMERYNNQGLESFSKVEDELYKDDTENALEEE